jgi:pantoate--beta-alanine ligase
VRPTHFRGVATVVLKLFNLLPANVAYFGQKDYQQSLVIRRLVADLNVPIEIHVCPIIREADGLAKSSRNVYLSPDERRRSLVISQAVQKAEELVRAGERSGANIVRAMQSLVESVPGVNVDYIVVADPETLANVSTITHSAVAMIAAKVGNTRLIDNTILQVD